MDGNLYNVAPRWARLADDAIGWVSEACVTCGPYLALVILAPVWLPLWPVAALGRRSARRAYRRSAAYAVNRRPAGDSPPPSDAELAAVRGAAETVARGVRRKRPADVPAPEMPGEAATRHLRESGKLRDGGLE